MLSSLGMEYKNYHACVNDCMLFRGTHENNSTCVKCGESHYKVGSDNVKGAKIPRKILRHFPIIPHLHHIFKCPSLAEYMDWHLRN
eukprot:c28346_g2_i1 orf=372-629(+)